MADRNEVLEQLTKLRLKVIEQKLAAERHSSSNAMYPLASLPLTGQVGGTSVAFMTQGAYSPAHQLLQAEALKNEQLLALVKEERHAQERKTQGQTTAESLTMEMTSLMMSQNVQLQQLLLNQMRGTMMAPQPDPPIRQQTEQTRPIELPQVSHREMTPFTTLPNNKPVVKDIPKPAPKVRYQPKPQTVRIPSPQTSISRGLATPIRPTELITQPKPRTVPQVEGFLNQPSSHDPNIDAYPFPGTRRIRKLRHVFHAAWFCFILIALLKKTVQRRIRAAERLEEMIKAAIAELHRRYYLNQDNAIWSSLYDIIKEGCFELKVKSPGVFGKLSQEQQATISELSSIVETVVYNVTEIKPITGILSSTREGVLWNMTQTGTFLPGTYLWEVEKEMMQFSDRGSIDDLDNHAKTMLVLGLFISRGLVSSLLLRPMESGLCPAPPSKVASSNLKVLGSILMKIVREVCVNNKKKPMPPVSEISSQLYSDEEMKFIYKKLDSTFIWCRANLFKWADAFVDTLNKS